MKYLLVLLVALSALSSHAEVDVNYDKNLVSLQAKIEQLTDEVERLKQNQKLEVSLLNQTDTSGIEQSIKDTSNKRLVSFSEFSEMSKSLMSRVDSTDESVSTILGLLGVVSAVWGILITIFLVILTYLHFGSLKNAVEESQLKMDLWLKTTALEKIEKISNEAEEKLQSIRDREATARKKVSELLEIKESGISNEVELTNESTSEHSKQLESAILDYKSGDFPSAILKSKLILEKDLDIKTRIEAVKIIANSYQAMQLNESAIKFNEELKELVSLYSSDKSDAKKAEIQLNIIMNKYPVDTSENNSETIKLINDLVSVYKASNEIEVIRSVAKARMLKAVAHENNGHYLNALTIYKDIVADYFGANDLELMDVVRLCRKNIEKIQERT
ncbi:hypothetical protein L1076_26240 [Vibrio sp. MMG022]|uniref:hypothetical protein n=1 Tax=Vibrio sp. MMG023 TaxID=2909979 RepID=UPI001F42C9A9|nr:hypothetical protein [Vibrio sp. MMG023]MCF6455092.1 hypothetical protein [Vibrio sp. MMG023]